MSLKEAKHNYIIEQATSLFLKRSVGEVTVKDISDEIGVGEATLYRYFGKKQNIVIRCALSLQNIVYKNYFILKGKCGYDKIKAFYDGYLKIFEGHSEYYKFISEFDAFMIAESHKDIDEYSAGLDMFIKEFLCAYEEGVKDGTVKANDDIETFYYATTHSLLELCKKLSGAGIVKQDEKTSKEAEIRELIDIILYSIKNP